MSKASKRRQAAQRAAPPSESTGPSGQLLVGLGLALVVVVVVVLVAGGGLGQPTAPGAPKPAATAGTQAVSAAEVSRLEAAIKANPANSAAMIDLGNLYYDAGRFTEAIPWYARALDITPNDTNARTDMATAYYYSGDTNRAIEEGRKVLAVDPNKVQTRLNMGIWLTSLTPPNTAEAIQHWQIVANLYPGTDTAKQAQNLISQYSK